MIVSMEKQSTGYHFSHPNADSGFDVKSFLVSIEQMEMILNIKQYKRNIKKIQQTYCFTWVFIFMQTDLRLRSSLHG